MSPPNLLDVLAAAVEEAVGDQAEVYVQGVDDGSAGPTFAVSVGPTPAAPTRRGLEVRLDESNLVISPVQVSGEGDNQTAWPRYRYARSYDLANPETDPEGLLRQALRRAGYRTPRRARQAVSPAGAVGE